MSRWALGVLLYEFVTGQPPFYDDDRVKMFRKICEVRFSFPVGMSQVILLGQTKIIGGVQELRDLIRRLLVKKPAMRLGAQKKGAQSIKSHPWFEGFDWNSFEKQKLVAPYIPKVKLLLCSG